jgi:hypothetical protein
MYSYIQLLPSTNYPFSESGAFPRLQMKVHHFSN